MALKTAFDYFEKYAPIEHAMVGSQQYWDECLPERQKKFWRKVAKLFNQEKEKAKQK